MGGESINVYTISLWAYWSLIKCFSTSRSHRPRCRQWAQNDAQGPADDKSTTSKLIQNFNRNILKRYEEFVKMDTRKSFHKLILWLEIRNFLDAKFGTPKFGQNFQTIKSKTKYWWFQRERRETKSTEKQKCSIWWSR